MSVNLKYAVDQRKVANLGKYIASMDFEVNSTSKENLQRVGQGTNAGVLSIGNSEFQLTLAEVDHLIQTLQSAKHVFFHKYRFGM